MNATVVHRNLIATAVCLEITAQEDSVGTIAVRFRYLTGLRRPLFRNARLVGNWDAQGRLSGLWSEVAMQELRADDGCPAFLATVDFDAGEVGKSFQWGVRCDTLNSANLWTITTEVSAPERSDRVRELQLRPAGSDQVEDYYFTYARRLGARKIYRGSTTDEPWIRFAVWAPNAQSVDVVFGYPAHGYIADDGHGIDPSRSPLPMTRTPDGIWQTDALASFASHEGLPYMYRIRNAQGATVYRTDLYSRLQIGAGSIDPGGAHWDGPPELLEGSKSCSVVMTMESVARDVVPATSGQAVRIPDHEFWASEFTPGLPVPTRFQDLVIYELHVASLGFGKDRPGNFEDAIALLPHLSDLGVNAVELLPVSETSGVGWGYGDSHHFVVESGAGGRDQYKHFVRACHRRGIAVIQDVVYNHWDPSAERAEWQYDSTAPEQNIYYWYEGRSHDHASPDGGYLDNGSTGYCPRFWEEMVRQVFVSSAAAFIEDCHVDGLRVDLTQAIHRDNVLHADGRSVASANQFGAKMLREWSRTLRLIKPSVILVAEDHSRWNKVTQLPEIGGLGFDAAWFAAFYHNLIGGSDMAGGRAQLLRAAGQRDSGGLDLSQFASVLYESKLNKIVYHVSHDEAGNSAGSMRTLPCAVNGAALTGLTRDYAEARMRTVFALSLFSAGTPMFFMGEEIGAQRPYRYNDFLTNREDILGERLASGARLFRYFQDAIRFSSRHIAIRAQTIDIIHVNDEARVIAFRRSVGTDELLVLASLNNHAFDSYVVGSNPARLPDGGWTEQFNSNAGIYGGNGEGNGSNSLFASEGRIQVFVPANSAIVLVRA